MLNNTPTLAIVAVHTEENEPLKIWGDLFSLFTSLLKNCALLLDIGLQMRTPHLRKSAGAKLLLDRVAIADLAVVSFSSC